MPKTRRRRFDRFVRREVSTNAIEKETETGKATTIAPRAEESIQIVDGNAENIVHDGPLDSESIYSGFIEVIGMYIANNQMLNGSYIKALASYF